MSSIQRTNDLEFTQDPNGTQLETEVSSIVNTFNNHDQGILTWTNVKATTLSATTASITTLSTINAPTFSSPLPIASGGTNSGAALNNNRIMVSQSSAIEEASALTASKPMRTDTNGLPTTGSTSLTSEVTGVLPIANGGTNSGTTLNNGKVIISSGGKIVESALVTLNAAGYHIGSIVQIISANSSTPFTTSSSTYQTTNLTATITPLASTNIILVFATGDLELSTQNNIAEASLFRGSTNISINNIGSVLYGAAANVNAVGISLIKLDSPSTTSATTYSVKLLSTNNTNGVTFGNYTGQYMLLLELAQ